MSHMMIEMIVEAGKWGTRTRRERVISPPHSPVPQISFYCACITGLLHFLARSQPLMEPPPCWSVVLLSWTVGCGVQGPSPKVKSFLWLPDSCEKSWLTVGQSLSRELGARHSVKEPCSGRQVPTCQVWEPLLVFREISFLCCKGVLL